MRRVELNYEKEGFKQIFPVLYIKNDNETAWVVGLWKWNIAFVDGYNVKVVEHTAGVDADTGKYKNGGLVQLYSNLSTKQKDTLKTAVIILGGVAVITALAYMIRKVPRKR